MLEFIREENACEYYAEEIANDEKLWNDYANADGDEPIGRWTFEERVDIIMELYPDVVSIDE